MTNFDNNEQKVRPTLLIGIGGTGYKIIVRAKARFKETYPPDILEQIRFIVFDTDPNQSPVRNSVGELVALDSGIEFIEIGGVPVNDIRRNQDSYPEIKAEIDLQRLPRVALIRGAKQVRSLGRLAFFHHFQRVTDAIQGALNSILNIASHSDAAASVQSVNVFFVASACGGTGSGSILDLAYLTRHIASTNLGIPDDRIFNNGLLILPEAFKVPVTNRNVIRANASAMLAELDHFTNYQDFDVTYPNGMRVRDTRPPFNITYLVDAVNKNRLTIQDLNQLAPIMAEAVFLQTGSYLGGATASAFDNVPTAISTDRHGFLKAYSMVGTSSLRFNSDRMYKACALRLVHRLVSDVLLKDNLNPARSDTADNLPDHPHILNEVEGYLSNANLTIDLLRQELKKMPEGQSMTVNLNSDRFNAQSKHQIVRKVEAYCDRYEQQTIKKSYLSEIEKNRIKLASDSQDLLGSYVYRLCDEQGRGIPAAQQFLAELGPALEPLRQALTNERNKAKQNAARIQRQVNNDRKAFDEATLRFDPWGLLGTVRNARRRYTESRRRYLTHLLSQGLANQGLLVLEEIEKQRLHLTGALANLQGALEKAAREAHRELESLKANWHSSHLTEQNIDTAADIQNYYDRHLSSIGNSALELFRQKPLRSWLQEFESNAEKAAKEIVSRLSEHAYNSFTQIVSEERVEDQIKAKKPEERNKILHNLIALSAPFSNYDPTASGHGSEDLNTILLVGTYNHDASIYTDASLGNIDATLVSTLDKQRISVLHTKHGLALYSLRQYNVYKKHFADYRDTSGLLCFKVVQQEREAYKFFAQAEAYGFIEKQGVVGFVLTTQNGSWDLGENLRSALEYVVRNQQLQDEIEHELWEWSRHHKKEQVIELLDNYIRRREEHSPKPLDQELRILAQGVKDYYEHQ